jgi:hypothetical protein
VKVVNLRLPALIAALLMTCTSTPPDSPPPVARSGYLNLGHLEVGQKNKYVSFSITNDTVKTYNSDACIMEVTGETDSGYVISNSLSSHSANFPSTYTYVLRVVNDTFRVTSLSESLYLAWLAFPDRFTFSYRSEGTVPFDGVRPRYVMVKLCKF